MLVSSSFGKCSSFMLLTYATTTAAPATSSLQQDKNKARQAGERQAAAC
jgi:hypothetical protein